jgi:hypothetical protein
MIVGIYKATLIEALEVETFILLLDLYIKRLAACIAARIHIIKAAKEIKLIYNQIY